MGRHGHDKAKFIIILTLSLCSISFFTYIPYFLLPLSTTFPLLSLYLLLLSPTTYMYTKNELNFVIVHEDEAMTIDDFHTVKLILVPPPPPPPPPVTKNSIDF